MEDQRGNKGGKSSRSNKDDKIKSSKKGSDDVKDGGKEKGDVIYSRRGGRQ